MILQEPLGSKSYSAHQPLRSRAIGLVTALAGATFIGTAGLTTLTCQRSSSSARLALSQGDCTLNNSSLFHLNPVQIKLSDLHEAQLKRRYGHPYYVAYQVILVTSEGEVPITEASPTERGWKAQVTSDINGFLNTPQRSTLTLQLNDQGWCYIVGLLLATAGTGFSLLSTTANPDEQVKN